MADIGHLEKMGNELKCPICLSLFDSASSIPCNHIFCDSCIKKSMKSVSSCPVCKIPFHRRELRAAPHMDNLVSIFKSMEFAARTNIVSSQLEQNSKQSDGSAQNSQRGNFSGANSSKAKIKSSPKKKSKGVSTPKPNSSESISNPKITNPSFPAKKRVQVTPFPLNETPTRPEKVLKLSDLKDQPTENEERGQSAKMVDYSQKSPSFLPFFWMREVDEDEEKEEEENESVEKLSDSTPQQAPCFSDIKDSDDEFPLNSTPISKIKTHEPLDRNFFCSQRPCSQKICLTTKKNKGYKKLDQVREDAIAPNDEIIPVINETQVANDSRERKPKSKRKRNNKVSLSVSNERIVNKSEENVQNSMEREKVGDMDKPSVSKRKYCKRNPVKESNCRNVEINPSISNKRAVKKLKENSHNSIGEKRIGEMDKSLVLKRNNNCEDNPENVTNSIFVVEKDNINDEKESNRRKNISKVIKINESGSSNFSLKKCKSIPPKVLCAFCHSSEVTEISGEMVHYYEGIPVNADFNGKGNVINSHRNCLEWAPEVYFEDDVAVNINAELARSKRIKCCCCGIKGAALGCLEMTCRKSFHFTCAKLIPECKWDYENFVMLCPFHSSSKLPVETSQIPVGPSQVSSVKTITNDSSQAWKWNPGSPCKWVLSCSGLSVKEKELVSKFSKITGVPISKTWSPSITHVIASTNETGACKRTLKYLMAILTGKWILTIDWIKVCMEAMEPIYEENFEVKIDVHGIKDGAKIGRLRTLNKEAKLFNQIEFYLIGDYTKDYKGFIQDLIIAAGGTVLQRKPISRDQQRLLEDSSSIYIIYSIENREKETKRDERVLVEANALADVAGGKIASTAWIIDSIAACNLQTLI